MASQKLTEYERRRLENIRRNDEMMASLKIHSRANELSAATKRQRVQTKSYKVSPEKKAKIEEPIVIRRSLRARGMPPDFTTANGQLKDKFLETLIMTFKSPSSPKKPSPPDLGPLNMSDAYSGSTSDRTLIETITAVSKKSQLSPSIGIEFGGDKGSKDRQLSDSIVGVPKTEPFGCPIKREGDVVGGSLDLSDLIVGVPKNEPFGCPIKREGDVVGGSLDLGSLNLEPENIARVVPGRILVVRFFPSMDVEMIVAGNKFGNVGFWDVKSKKEEGDGIYLYRPHTAPVSGISIQPFSLSKIFTSCYDGFIRLMDVEKELFDLVYSSDNAIFSLSQRPNDAKSLYFSEGHGGLNIWDDRAGKSSTSWILHEDRINSINFNSENTNIMATSSTDGTACIWDLRSIDADKPKTLKIVNHQRAVHSAYFSPSGSFLATTSIDNKVGLFGGPNFEDMSMIYHDNQTGRWISSFRAIWGWDDSYIFLGNMKRGVDVISAAHRKTIMTLQSPHMSAIPCRFDAHPYKVGMLAGATSGGQVYMWTSC